MMRIVTSNTSKLEQQHHMQEKAIYRILYGHVNAECFLYINMQLKFMNILPLLASS